MHLQRMHHLYDNQLEAVGLEDMEQWSRGLENLVGAIDRELLKDMGPCEETAFHKL